MGFFDLKAICSNCQKEIGLNRFKIKDGWICPECFRFCTHPIINKTILEVQNDILLNKDKKEKLDIANNQKKEEQELLKQVNVELFNNFNATKKIGSYIEFDEEKKQWLIPNGFFENKKKPRVYSFYDIVECELLENGDTITKGGLGSAITGGLLFGGVGAIVGGVTGSKKSKSIINSLKIKITVNDFQNPAVFINLISSSTKADSFIYKTFYTIAQQILSTLSLIQKQKDMQQKEISSDEQKNTFSSSADEIFKFKSLLDSGVITQEEFEMKKKQLLNLNKEVN